MHKIKDPGKKFEILRAAIGAAPHPDGLKWRRGVSGLSEFLIWSEALRNGQSRPTRRVENLQPELSRCKKSAPDSDCDRNGEISDSLLDLFVSAFDIDDQRAFLTSAGDDVAQHVHPPTLPNTNTNTDAGALELIAQQPDYIWRPDNLSSDLSCNQGYDLEPSLEIDAMRFKIVGMDYAYAFKSLSLVITAPKGSAIGFENRLGLRTRVTQSPYVLGARGTAGRAQFVVAPEPVAPEAVMVETAGIIEGHAFFETPLFTVTNARAGEEITIETRVAQRDGALLAIDADNTLEPQQEDFIERLLARDARAHAPKPATPIEHEPADQYITLVRQRLIVARKVAVATLGEL